MDLKDADDKEIWNELRARKLAAARANMRVSFGVSIGGKTAFGDHATYEEAEDRIVREFADNTAYSAEITKRYYRS